MNYEHVAAMTFVTTFPNLSMAVVWSMTQALNAV